MLLPFVLFGVVGILIYIPPVQQFIRKKAVSILHEKTGAEVNLDHLALRFPIGLSLEGLFVGDQHDDTLLYAGTLKARVGLTALFNQRIVLGGIQLEDVRATVIQTPDSTFNFDFIVDMLSGTDTASAPVDTNGGWEFAIEDIALRNIRLDLRLAPSDLFVELQLGDLELDFDRFELDPMRFYVDEIALSDSRVAMRTVSGPAEPNPYPTLTNPLDSLDIRFNAIGLENVSFSMKTTNTGDSLWVKVPFAELSTESIDLTKQQITMDELVLRGFRFGMLGHASADTTTVSPPWLDQNDGFRYFVQDWNVKAHEVRITESEIELHTGVVTRPDSLLDLDHLVINDLTLSVNGLIANNGRVAARIKELSATTGPSNTPLQLTSDLAATPERMALNNGSIQVGGNRVAFSASALPGSLSALYHAPENVPLKLQVNTDLDLQRLRPLLRELGIAFPPELNATEIYATNARIAGTIAHMDTLAVELTGNQGTALDLKGRIANASAWPRTAFVVDLDRFSMGEGLREMLAEMVPKGTRLPNRFDLQARANGNNGRITGELDVHSDFGNVRGDITASGLDRSIPDAFTLALAVNDLRLQRITGDTTIGPMSFDLTGEGRGMNTPARMGHVEFTPRELRFNGNDMSSLQFRVDAEGDSLHTTIRVENDLADLDLMLHTTWPDPKDSVRAVVEIAIDELHLQELGVMPYPLNVEGRWRGKAMFSTEGAGSIDLVAEGLRLSNGAQDFKFEEFAAHAFLGTDSTAMELNSDAITLAYHTNIPVDSVLPRTQAKLANFFSNDTDFVATPGKHMDLAITLPRTEWLTGLLVPGLDAIQLERFTGAYNSDTDELRLDIAIPFLEYDSTHIDELVVNVDAKGTELNGDVSVQRAQRGQFYVEGLAVDAKTTAGTVTTTLRIIQNEIERYRIGFDMRSEGVRTIHLANELILDQRTWNADPNNLLRFGANMEAEQFIISSGEERVQLITEPEHLVMEFQDFEVGSIARMISSTDSMDLVAGKLDGTIRLPQADGLLRGDITISELHILGTELGDLGITMKQRQQDQYHAALDLTHTSNRLNAEALITTGASVGLDAQVDMDLQDLSFLKPFVDEYLYAIEGGIKGDIAVQVQHEKTSLHGDLTFVNAGIGVELTGAKYILENERLTLDDAGAHFDRFQLRDSLGNTFELDGDVGMADPTRPKLDLQLRTDKFQMINSTIKQNDLFYGDLFSSMDLKITGTAQKPVLKGDVGILPGTEFSVVLPGSEVELVDAQGVVIFTDDLHHTDSIAIATDSEMLRDSIQAQLPGIELDLAISVDKEAIFAIVLDPTTGDEATFSGSGDLIFRYKPDGDIYLSGPFTIEEGGYTLEFYGLVKKRFDLVKGSSITWSGDPIKAVMDIRARYTSNSAPYSLVASANSSVADIERNRLQQPLPFNVIISIGGKVDDPKIDFGIDLARDLRNSYPQVSSRLDQLAQTGQADELNKQVFGLLVLNSFIQDEASGGSPSSGIASTAARNSVNGLLTEQMNKLTGKFIKGVDISLGVNTYDQSTGNQTYQRTSVDYKVSKRILNDRLSFEVGGSVGVDEQSSQVSNVSNTRAAQYAILYDLTKDGRFRLRGFHENAYDLYDGEITNSGVAFMFTKDFEENERAREKSRNEAEQRRENEKKTRP